MLEAPPQPRLGKYELRGELGRGAMGVVYRAYDHVLQREVALKTMGAPSADGVTTRRFLQEARTAGSLHHPNIVTIHELGQESGTYFIAMELLRGRSLYDLVRAEERPPLARRLEIVARVCDGLDFAHRAGIVHRDIKPGNVFLPADGAVKILDFGIAKITASDQTRTGLVIGTVDYMSPEQVRAAKDLDGRSDIFSAGVILYELIFGRRPFSADDMGAALHRILHEQPPGYGLFEQVLGATLADVLRRSLDKRREARFARAGEMAAALDGAIAALHGRAGTELEERIQEVVASGILDRAETSADPFDAASTSAATSPLAPTASEVRPRRWRVVPYAFAGLALVAAAVAVEIAIRTSPAGPASAAAAPVPPVAVALDARPEPTDAVPSAAALPAGAPDAGSDVDDAAIPPPEAPAPDSAAGPTPGESVPLASTPAAPVPAAPLPLGFVDLAVMPWAAVEWIENLDTGERRPSDAVAPGRLELPQGRYRVRMTNPYAAAPLELDVVVRGDATEVVRRSLPGFDPADLAQEILAREARKGRVP